MVIGVRIPASQPAHPPRTHPLFSSACLPQGTFDDFIGASEYLIAQGWASPRKLAIAGLSNGGLLVSATMLQRPDLFAAVLADVPVTDALRRHLSGNGMQQIEQWGTPDDPAVFPALRAYSPVHNVTAGKCYPATLITAAHDDQRAPPWHAYKFAAALQAAQGPRQLGLSTVPAASGQHDGEAKRKPPQPPTGHEEKGQQGPPERRRHPGSISQ